MQNSFQLKYLPEKSYRWGVLAKKVTIHKVKGEHVSVLKNPNVQSLGEQFYKAIKKL